MELILQQFIEALEFVSDVENLSDDTPQVIRRSNPSVGETSTFVCSLTEPYNMVLPLNVIWIDFDKNSPTFRHALKRKSKDADPAGKYNHTWEVLYYFEHLWEKQYYDADDLVIIGGGNNTGPATTTSMGIVKISHAPADGGIPVAITEGNPRLSDARTPKKHSHPEIPATQLQHKDGVLHINNNAPVVGAVLKALSPTSAGWAKLTEDDIQD